jgi:hypothetical protein
VAEISRRVSGGPARGYSWESFKPGNTVSVTHGCHSLKLLGPRAAEITAELREIVPCASPADEPTIQLLGLTLARLERGTIALQRLDEIADESGSALAAYTSEEAAKFDRLREDTRSWVRLARSLCNDLGLTPTSRARLGLDVARAQESVVVALQREARAREGAA